MQQFQVPQFITVEDKIIGGFLTAKQFIYVAAGIILIIGINFFFTGFLVLFLSFIIGVAAISFAWGKIDGRPIPIMALNAIMYFVKPRIFIWKRSEGTKTPSNAPAPEESGAVIQASPKLSRSRLSELSWTLDTKTHGDTPKE